MAYSINYTNVVHDTLPPDKRSLKHAKWLIALLAPLTWLKDEFFGHYMQGANFPAFVPFSNYPKGARVTFNRTVWESLIDNNTHPIPHPVSWKRVYNTILGAEERIWYNGHTLVLEYALNRMFSKTFRQPPQQSDIYIITHRVTNLPFLVGGANYEGGSIGLDDSIGYIRAGQLFYPDETAQAANFTIYAPQAIPGGEDAIARFAKQYIPLGINFNVELYY
jgi:hypothetical protein